MLNIDDFKDFSEIFPLIERLNFALEKYNQKRVTKILLLLENYCQQEKYTAPLSYLISVIAEESLVDLPQGIIEKAFAWLGSPLEKVRLNSTAIIGLYLMNNDIGGVQFTKHLSRFIPLLKDNSEDVRNNVMYFLQKLKNKVDFSQYFNVISYAIRQEYSEKNIALLLDLIYSCQKFDMKTHQQLRSLLTNLIPFFISAKTEQIFDILILIVQKFFPLISEPELHERQPQEVIDALNDTCIMKRFQFQKPQILPEDEDGNYFSSIINIMKEKTHKEVITFYITSKGDKELIIYQLEKEPLLRLFN